MKDTVIDSTKKCIYGIFNDSYPPILDGVTLTVENYAKSLNEMGRKPVVVTPWNPMQIESDYDVYRFFSLPIASRHPYRYGYPKLDPFIWRKLRKTNFCILHSHCPFSSGRLSVYAKHYHNIPLIGTFHSKYRTDLEHSFKRTPWMVDIIMKRILNFFNECDEVWIPQAEVEATVREYGYKGALTVVENGNDFADFSMNASDDFKIKAKSELGIREDEISLLFVGQHIWEKGTDIIIDALNLIKEKVKFKMNFIGTGYAAEEMKSRVREYNLGDRVKFNGVISDRKQLMKYYAAADVFLFPSLYDNAPLVVREAAAMLTPSVIPEGSTASEVIRNGENGFLSRNTPISYANVIEYLSNNRDIVIEAGKKARMTLTRGWDDVMREVTMRYDALIERYKKEHGLR